MYNLQADKVFNNEEFFEKFNIEDGQNISLDFSDVKELGLNDINTLLKLQKLAIFNNFEISFTNLEPQISDMLDKTGIYRTFNMTNPIKMVKRFNFYGR